jgi:excisionase family DNA binding protein
MASETAGTISTAKAARLLEVGPSTVKRWADEGVLPCVKTAGGHRRFHREAIDRFLAEQRGVVDQGELDVWLDALVGDEDLHRVGALLLAARAEHGTWWRVADALGPVMEEVGQRWSEGRISVLQEHVATERLARALASCAQNLAVAPEAPRCLLFAADGDDHTLGLSLAEICLREAGWSCRWAGRRTPAGDVEDAVRSGQVQMLAVSASAACTDGKKLGRQYRGLAEAAQSRGVVLVLGGSGAWPEDPPYGHRLRSFRELSSLLARLSP